MTPGHGLLLCLNWVTLVEQDCLNLDYIYQHVYFKQWTVFSPDWPEVNRGSKTTRTEQYLHDGEGSHRVVASILTLWSSILKNAHVAEIKNKLLEFRVCGCDLNSVVPHDALFCCALRQEGRRPQTTKIYLLHVREASSLQNICSQRHRETCDHSWMLFCPSAHHTIMSNRFRRNVSQNDEALRVRGSYYSLHGVIRAEAHH